MRTADIHMPPAARRWTARIALAVVVAACIGYVPAAVLRHDPRAAKLEGELDGLERDSRELAAGNASLVREIDALRTDVAAIEDHARADLGMVYPDEIVLRVRAPGSAVTPAAPSAVPAPAAGGAP